MVETSDKILEQDPQPEFPKFIPTFSEWSAVENFQQIIADKLESQGAGDVDVFEVPKNKTFFITTALLSCFGEGTSGGGGISQIRLFVNNLDTEILGFPAPLDSVFLHSQTQTFTMPIKLNESEKVIVRSSSNILNTKAIVTGFLIDKFI